MRKKLLLSVLVGVLLLLTACGINLDTRFIADSNFKGTRYIDCSMNKTELENIDQQEETLNKVIKDYCPESMIYENKSSDDQLHYIFKLSFKSFDDYKNKVNDCLNFKPEIEFQTGNNPFMKGLLFKENFSSKDLMTWFTQGLIKEGLLKDSDSENIWNIKGTSFEFDHTDYNTDNIIAINDIKYLSMGKICIYTSENKDGTYTQKVIFWIPEKTMNENGQAVKKFLTKDLNSSYYVKWDTYKGGKQCSISYSAATMNELNKYAKNVFHSTVTGHISNEVSTSVPFEMERSFDCHYDLSAFQSTENAAIKYEYYYKPLKKNVLYGYSKSDLSKDGYYKILDGNSESISTNIKVYEKLMVDSLNLTTIYYNSERMQREMNFVFHNKLSSSEEKSLISHFEKYGFEKVEVKKHKQMSLMFIGSPDAISNAFCNALYLESPITAKTTTHKINNSKNTVLTDTYNLTNIPWYSKPKGYLYFISNSDETLNNISIVNNKKAGTIEKLDALKKGSVSDSSELIHFKSEHQYKITKSGVITLTYEGGITDFYKSILFLIAVPAIAFVTVILIFYLNRKRIYKLLSRKKRG